MQQLERGSTYTGEGGNGIEEEFVVDIIHETLHGDTRVSGHFPGRVKTGMFPVQGSYLLPAFDYIYRRAA